MMAFYDKQRLFQDVDSLTLAEYIGLTPQKRGSYYFIPCPSHHIQLGKNDEHAKNCYLTKRGYKCQACGKNGNSVDMVMDYYDMLGQTLTYGDALGIIADSCGGREFYVTSGKTEKKEIPFSKSFLNLIGICTSHTSVTTPICLYDYKSDMEKTEKTDDGYIVYNRTPNNFLYDLYLHDKKTFLQMIQDKSNEAVERLEYVKNSVPDVGDISFYLKAYYQDCIDQITHVMEENGWIKKTVIRDLYNVKLA